MKRIIIWYNANRKSIWKVIGIIVVAFATIQFVQYIWIQKQIEQKKTNIPNIDTIDSIQAQLNSITLEEERATVSGEKIIILVVFREWRDSSMVKSNYCSYERT